MSFDRNKYLTSAPIELKLPRAQKWRRGMDIQNQQGEVLFRVEDNVNDGTDIEPKFRLFLQDDENNIVSVVKFHRGAWSVCWEIYTSAPNYPGQPRGLHLFGAVDQDMYLYGKLYGNKQFRRCIGKDNEEELVYTLKSLSGGKCCCFGSTKRVLEFKAPDGNVAMTRDQNNETLALLAGQNILIAAALTYAVDRFWKMLGSKSEREHRERSAQHVGSAFGLIGAAIAASVDSGRKKIQHGDIYIEDFKQQ
jgi:hypothetical protein